MCTQRSLKHVRTTYALGAFHGRFLHRSERRASSRCEQSIIDIRSVVTAAEIMLPNARASRGPLPIDRVTKYIDHGVARKPSESVDRQVSLDYKKRVATK